MDLITKNISDVDSEQAFFHYTSRRNLPSILENGLEPRIGENSLYVETTPKVFFAKGERGILAMADVWLRWLTGKIYVGKFKYWFATRIYMRLPFCIKGIPNHMTKQALANKERRFAAYAKMKKIWDDSVFLVLDLEDGVDFSYDDIDEVKSSYYESFLKLLYPKDSDLKDQRVEYWNMQTYSHRIISPEKITLLKGDGCGDVNTVLINLVGKNSEYVRENFEFLYECYDYINSLRENGSS